MSRVFLGVLVGVAAVWLSARSSADAPPAAPAPREKRPPTTDPQLKTLERLEAVLAREVAAREAELKELAADGGMPDGRVASLRARVNEQDAAIHALDRDIARAEAERRVLLKQLLNAPKSDPELVARQVMRDPRVAAAEDFRRIVGERLAAAKDQLDPNNPLSQRLRAELARAEKQLSEATEAVTKEVEGALAKKATDGAKADAAKLAAKLAIDEDVRERFRADLVALRKELAEAEAAQFTAEKLRDELKPLREELGKVRLDLIRVRVERESAGK